MGSEVLDAVVEDALASSGTGRLAPRAALGQLGSPSAKGTEAVSAVLVTCLPQPSVDEPNVHPEPGESEGTIFYWPCLRTSRS